VKSLALLVLPPDLEKLVVAGSMSSALPQLIANARFSRELPASSAQMDLTLAGEALDRLRTLDVSAMVATRAAIPKIAQHVRALEASIPRASGLG